MMLTQLSGMDSMFLYAESHRAPLEVGCIQIYDPSTAPQGAVRFKEILAMFQDRLDRWPLFRQKLVEVPLSLDHPYWGNDDNFDLEYHVRHISLPQPGDWAQLMAQAARLQARQLDHSKPLWMAHVIEGLDKVEGLPPGCFAIFLKMHHSTVDGVTGQGVQAAMHDLEPHQVDASSYKPSAGPPPGKDPGMVNVLARAPLNAAIKSTKLGFGLLRALPGMVSLGLSRDSAGRPHVPMTPLNDGRVTPNRVVDGRFFTLEDFKRIRAQYEGVKINDVVLAVIGGALRYYLDARDELPTATLIAGCPINVGTEADAEQGRGNLLSLMTPQLHTEIEDPVERLLAIHQSTIEAKSVVEKLGNRTMTEVPMNLPAPIARNLYPLLAGIALRTETLPYNTMVTNVAVRHAPLYLAGARLIRVLATGPVIDQSGVFHACFSFDGEVSIGFTACREMLPDPAFYAECIEASFEDLRQAAIGSRVKKKRTKKAASKQAAARKKAGAASRKPATKKKAAKKKAEKKKVARKKTAKKKTAKKKATRKKSATRKTAAKKSSSKKTTRKKISKKKTVRKKAGTKKVAAKKTTARQKAVPRSGRT
jgi:WS/DGAT/MGAT family acyltransferase